MTYVLIGINVAVSLLAFSAFQKQDRPERFLFIPSVAAAGGNRLGMLLSGFSHADGTHLIFNMITLYFFAPQVELGLGSVGLLALYAVSGLCAGLVVYYFHRANPRYRALGASGSVSGVLFAAIVLEPRMSVFFFLIPVPIPGPVFAVLYLVLSTYFMRRQTGRISHEAHVGGALSGLLLAGLLAPEGFRPLLRRLADLLS